MRHSSLTVVSLAAAMCVGAAATARADFFQGRARAAAEVEAERLQAIKLRRKAQLFALPGVYGVGIGFDRNSGELLFKVMYEPTRSSPAIPARIEGVRVVAVKGRRPRPSDIDGTYANPAHAGQHSLPVKMGNSVRHANGCPQGCTLGFKACDTNTGQTVFVTADHCADDYNGCMQTAFDPMYHAAPADGASDCLWHDEVGVVSGHAGPTCGAPSNVDAAKIVSDDGLTDWEVRDIGLPDQAFALPFVGGLWSKSGRTTGYTAGEISQIHVDIVIDYDCCANDGEMQDLIELDTTSGNACLGGDSGAAVLDFYYPPHILGMLIAGDGTPCYAVPTATVLSALDLSLDPDFCVDLCPAEDAAGDGDQGAAMVAHARDLRSVLVGSELGKKIVRQYYRFAHEWSLLYASHPLLLAQTTGAFQATLPVIEALAARQPVTVTSGQIAALDALLAAHMQAAGSGPLQSQFAEWRTALYDPHMRRAFQVTVSGPAGDFDGDGFPDASDNCPTLPSTNQLDTDADGVGDACDNCVYAANPRVAPDFVYANSWSRTTGDQRDDDGDGFGNRCDGDFPGTAAGVVGPADLTQLRASLGEARSQLHCGVSGTRPCAIFDLDEGAAEIIGPGDLARFGVLTGHPPGPKCPTCPLECNGGELVSCEHPP